MEIDNHKITRGRSGRRQLRNRIGQLTRGDRTADCYVGVTSDYWRRAAQHEERAPHFERMVVLFETGDIGVAQDVERDLIEHTFLMNANHLPGGEGVRTGRETYYVYVLLEPLVEVETNPWWIGLGVAGVAGLALWLGGRRPQPELGHNQPTFR